mmetsp:Transcript_37538/g.67607  ORF Transcript_37538/g.67607 Transcript_37538/m.67607 type:complete len:541 (-) Transcript_37538:185-1807(-)
MTQPNMKSFTTNKQTPFIPCSSSAKLALVAILALLILMNASSLIVMSSSSSRQRRQPPSLRKNPRKPTKQRQQKQHWQVMEHYEDFEEYADSTYSKDDQDSLDVGEYSSMDGEDGVASIGTKEHPMDRGKILMSDSENEDGGDATEIRAVEEMKGSSYDEKWLRKVKSEGENKGKIAWLMSFPNSGTSFTSLLIRHASNATTATNYGMESHLGMDGKSVPVYDWSLGGPYWLHPPHNREADDDATNGGDENGKEDDYKSGTKLGKSGTYGTPRTSSSIMTKTHCGSRCAFCSPSTYLETSSSFLKQCLSGSRKVAINHDTRTASAKHDKKEQYEKQYHTYHPSLVEKAVHLIRNPFDNIVSRFHHEQKEHKKKGQTTWTSRYSNDATGFKKWCADEDALYAAAEDTADWTPHGYPADLPRYFNGVSCHGEFLRYVQWHVLSIRAVELLDIPVLYVYYEEYSTDLKAATDRMLDFLSLEGVGTLPYFDSNKDYAEYFTREERASASDFMRRVASDAGKELLERYWVELDFDKLRKQTKSIK